MQIEVKRLLPLLIGFVLVAVVLGLMIYVAGNSSLPGGLGGDRPGYTEEERGQVLESLRAPEGAAKPTAKDIPDLRAPGSGATKETAAAREQRIQSLQDLRAQ